MYMYLQFALSLKQYTHIFKSLDFFEYIRLLFNTNPTLQLQFFSLTHKPIQCFYQIYMYIATFVKKMFHQLCICMYLCKYFANKDTEANSFRVIYE